MRHVGSCRYGRRDGNKLAVGDWTCAVQAAALIVLVASLVIPASDRVKG